MGFLHGDISFLRNTETDNRNSLNFVCKISVTHINGMLIMVFDNLILVNFVYFEFLNLSGITLSACLHLLSSNLG